MRQKMSGKFKSSLYIVLIVFFMVQGIVVASADQEAEISWYSSASEDNSTEIITDVYETVTFDVISDIESVSWKWTVGGKDLDNNNSLLNYTFEEYGVYNVSVSGTFEGGRTKTVNWNVTAVLRMSDCLNNTVELQKKPQRIISLSPSNTEILFSLGLDSSIIGVTDYCNYPGEALDKDSVGSFTTPNVEKILELNPDLILASYGNDMDVLVQLKSLNLTMFCLNPLDVEDIVSSIDTVGVLTGEEQNASLITDDMRRRIDVIQNETDSSEGSHEKPGVLYVVWYDPMFVSGNNTYADDLLTIAGGVNIVSELDGWQEVNIESLIDKDPDVIICSGMGGGSYIIRDSIMNDTILAQTSAVKNGRIYPIEDPNTIERAGPRIAIGLETFYDLLKESPDATEPKEDETQPEQIEQVQNDPEMPLETEDSYGIGSIATMILTIAVILLAIYMVQVRRNG
ncbi:MAG: helical backbone metal receptor [Halobacteriota archaeon]|nr:helical backbone metal receptor [Halobacteriota archaeon]